MSMNGRMELSIELLVNKLNKAYLHQLFQVFDNQINQAFLGIKKSDSGVNLIERSK